MSKLTPALKEFLNELAWENPTPSEPWKLRANWDPQFPLATIDAAVRRGWIETRGDRHSASFAYRFTPAGRLALEDKP